MIQNNQSESVDKKLSSSIASGVILLEWSADIEPVLEATSNLNSLKTIEDEIWCSYTNSEAPDLAWLFFFGFVPLETIKAAELCSDLVFWHKLSLFYHAILLRAPLLEELREKLSLETRDLKLEEILAEIPLFPGSEQVDLDFLKGVFKKLHLAYQIQIANYTGSVQDFIREYNLNSYAVGKVFFHLVESQKNNRPFAFLATYSNKLGANGKSTHLPLKKALEEFGQQEEKLLDLLAAVYRSAKESKFIQRLIDNGEIFHPLSWGTEEAFQFLEETELYERSGIICRIPNWWSQKSGSTSLNIQLGGKKPSFVGEKALLDCRPEIFVSGLKISKKEAERLLEESEGLAQLKNKWIAIDHTKLRAALAAYEKAERLLGGGQGLSIKEAMSLGLSAKKILGEKESGLELGISHGEWLEKITEQLTSPETIKTLKPASIFKAKLRPYQQAGLNWLGFTDSLGLGACLADDMGLGKTVQVLAFLSAKKKNKITNLLIVPASLMHNWIGEIEKFCPQLNYLLAHPMSQQLKNNKKKDSELIEKDLRKYDLVITTYSMVQRRKLLQDFVWDILILDEAQAIKNPLAKQTKAAKALTAKHRIALSGTPIENRLSDLWSLFDFLNPGLLGNLSEFQSFSKNIDKNQQGFSKLRKTISPYILRRVKTDKNIIKDLPEKIEQKVFAVLSKKQIVLYKDLIDQLEEELKSSEGIQRKGLILASLMKFKQLSNHPDQYLGQEAFLEEDSGKFLRLRELASIIYEKRERLLVFTQFKEMAEPLHDFLANVFKRKGVVIHGSIPVKARRSLVNSFQNKKEYTPFMVLSLKAGGVGLNLTEANHVIHFDRWWNPAVENQATDRAFRIGQKRNVMVHKFITQGTIEEKIDQMLEAKLKQSQAIITSSKSAEGALTNMSNEELLKTLRGDVLR